MSRDYPTNNDDVIDSRQVIERIDELQAEREALDETRNELQTALDEMPEGDATAISDAMAARDVASDALDAWDEDNGAELKALVDLAEEAEGYAADWCHGETLIRDSYFETYAKEMAEDCGLIQEGASWPNTCIDWERAARELQMDYTSLDFDGVTYWVRS